MQKHRKIALGLIISLFLWLMFLAIQIYVYSDESHPFPADVGIVLGAEVWNNRPSPVFEQRIRQAIALYKGGQIQTIVFTGGVGKDDRLAESEVARTYAIQQGVAAEHIYYEVQSRTTRENLVYARGILEREGLKVLIVSDPLHMRRAVTIARDLGMDAYPSPTVTSRYQTWHSKLRFLLRETSFYASYLLRRPFMARQNVSWPYPARPS
jgi:uncharacterized SAM-binding protein YcdF (DUF218 family)